MANPTPDQKKRLDEMVACKMRDLMQFPVLDTSHSWLEVASLRDIALILLARVDGLEARLQGDTIFLDPNDEASLAQHFRFCLRLKNALDTAIPGLFNPLPPEDQALQADAEIFRDRALRGEI